MTTFYGCSSLNKSLNELNKIITLQKRNDLHFWITTIDYKKARFFSNERYHLILQPLFPWEYIIDYSYIFHIACYKIRQSSPLLTEHRVSIWSRHHVIHIEAQFNKKIGMLKILTKKWSKVFGICTNVKSHRKFSLNMILNMLFFSKNNTIHYFIEKEGDIQQGKG